MATDAAVSPYNGPVRKPVRKPVAKVKRPSLLAATQMVSTMGTGGGVGH